LHTISKKAIIIGGGPAGLTAAYEFIKHTDIQPVVIEMSDYWGGISRTVDYKGNKIDIGGHRFFSKSDVVMQWWNEILPIQSDMDEIRISYQNKSATIKNQNQTTDSDKVMLVRKRKSRIFFNKQFFDYPISLTPETVRKIGFFNTFLIGTSYIKASLFPIKDVQTLDQFFINRFGKRLYRLFFRDYTEKVWGLPCTEISAEWGAQRIKGLSITSTIIHYFKTLFGRKNKGIGQKDTETSLIEYFLYPKFGPGQMWEEVAEKVTTGGGILMKNSKVTDIHFNKGKIESITVKNRISGETEVMKGDYFLSTMPVNELISSMHIEIPENVSEVAKGLKYRDFITVGLLLEKMNYTPDDNWIYIQEPYVKVGRIQVFNNWSPFLVQNENTYWVGLEYFCNEGDGIWEQSEREMGAMAVSEMLQLGFIDSEADVLDFTVIRMPKTYPAYFGTYSRFDEIREFTDKIDNLFLVGRNGMHKYNNQDHSMLTAIQAVENIQKGITSKDNIWSINTEQEYHEAK
jgi:protoporphyrinogen oxidase